MAETLPRHLYFAGIIVVIVIMAGVALINEIAVDKPDYLGDEGITYFNNTLNNYAELEASSAEFQSTITNAPDPSLFGWLDALVGGVWNGLTNLFSTLNFLISFVLGVPTYFGLPSWLASLTVIMITGVILFTIFSAIFQKDT